MVVQVGTASWCTSSRSLLVLFISGGFPAGADAIIFSIESSVGYNSRVYENKSLAITTESGYVGGAGNFLRISVFLLGSPIPRD